VRGAGVGFLGGDGLVLEQLLGGAVILALGLVNSALRWS
jgi:hypothetical protein